MDEQGTRRLDALDEQKVTRLLAELASDLSPEGEYRTRHPEGYSME